MVEPTGRPALHALLGVPGDLGADDLRLAYDRAMAMAVRMGDNRRALALSQAFDALDGRVRQQVYPAVQHRRAAVDTVQRRPARRVRAVARGGGSSGRPGRRGRGSGNRLSRIRRRTIVIIVLIALAVPAVVTVALHWDQWLKRPGAGDDPRPSRSSTVVQQPVPTAAPSIPDAQTESPAGNARRVPVSTPVDANGFVTISCAATRRGASSVRFARPGDVVTCTNGAVPRILDAN